MILLGPPRDEAICGLSGLLLAAKGQAGDLYVPGARTPAAASGSSSALLLSSPLGLLQWRRRKEENRPFKLGGKTAM